MNDELLTLFLITLFTILVCFWVVKQYSPNLKKANSKDVDMLLDAVSSDNIAFRGRYLGEYENNIYIDYQTKNHPLNFISRRIIHTLYWIPINELTPETLFKLRRTRYDL
ncbi:hypothetical protein AADZ91_14170 [Colwelliaceae bacterium 6441]